MVAPVTPTSDEQSVPRLRRRWLAVLAIAAATLVEVVILATRGRFMEMFIEFELPLPQVALLALGPALPAALAVILVATIAKEFMPRWGAVADLWNVGVVCLSLIGLGLYVAGIFAPLMDLMEALS
jgi:hypothetical protein